MPYIGDIPAQPVTIDPPETIDLADYTDALASLHTPAGDDHVLVASIVDEQVIVEFPADESLFTVEGVHLIRVTLYTPGGAVANLPAVRFVVQDPDSGWHTLDSVRDEWGDAEHIPDPTLFSILTVAREQCLTFAPLAVVTPPVEPPPPVVVPENYRLAQRVQARNIWNAARVAPDGSTGQDDYVIRPFPLDWHVKQILRPKRGVPVVG